MGAYSNKYGIFHLFFCFGNTAGQLSKELCFAFFTELLGWLGLAPGGGGGGGTSLYQLYRYVLPQRVWFLSRFGLKTGIDFDHYGFQENHESVKKYMSF